MRVLDLSRLLPGPFATLCLQGLGAEVVKVEDPNGGDYVRHMPPRIGEHGAWFYALNRGKKSVALDLKSPAGKESLLTLVATADVLVESFRPGVMARLGLAPDELRARFPRLVIGSLTGWGQTGPYAQLPGHDIGFLSIAGLLSADPRVPKMQWADIAAGGLVAALRILDAAHRAERTGRGAWLDIAMLDGLVGVQQAQFAQVAAGAAPDRMLTGGFCGYGVYRCLDGGWISIGAVEPQFFAVLTAQGVEPTEEAIAAHFASAPRDAWFSRLAGACVVPILDPSEVRTDPQVAARDLFDGNGLPHPPTGRVEGEPPGLGEHTAAELERAGYRRA